MMKRGGKKMLLPSLPSSEEQNLERRQTDLELEEDQHYLLGSFCYSIFMSFYDKQCNARTNIKHRES